MLLPGFGAWPDLHCSRVVAGHYSASRTEEQARHEAEAGQTIRTNVNDAGPLACKRMPG